MNALVLKEAKSKLVIEERDQLSPASGQVVVRLTAAALNRRDYWITQGMYPGIKLPVVLGSDGVGVVSKTGEGVADSWADQEVIINPGWDWGSNYKVQSGDFHILGMPADGTFAEEVVVPAEYVHAKPSHLKPTHAAAIPLAGVTAYRALFTQADLKAAENVLVTGAGGGVATFAIQYAVAAGANVFVTSSSGEKIAQAIALGAKAGFDYTDRNWGKKISADAGMMNVIIDSAGGENYSELLKLAAPGGRIVNYGATTGPPEQVDLFKVFWKQLSLRGSTMGSPADFAAMLKFVESHKIEPVIDSVIPLADANDGLQKMKSSKQFGKLVFEI